MDHYIPTAVETICFILTVIFAWGKFTSRVEDQLRAIREWRQEREEYEIALNKRISATEREMGSIKTSLAIQEERYRTIQRSLDKISDYLEHRKP